MYAKVLSLNTQNTCIVSINSFFYENLLSFLSSDIYSLLPINLRSEFKTNMTLEQLYSFGEAHCQNLQEYLPEGHNFEAKYLWKIESLFSSQQIKIDEKLPHQEKGGTLQDVYTLNELGRYMAQYSHQKDEEIYFCFAKFCHFKIKLLPLFSRIYVGTYQTPKEFLYDVLPLSELEEHYGHFLPKFDAVESLGLRPLYNTTAFNYYKFALSTQSVCFFRWNINSAYLLTGSFDPFGTYPDLGYFWSGGRRINEVE